MWLLIAGAVLLGIGAWVALSRWRPTPLPYSQRFLLVPLPNLAVARLRELLRPAPGERLLEIGPGTGNHALDVAKAVQSSGSLGIVDVQGEMLDHVMGRAGRRHLDNIEPTLADARELPLPSESVDGAYMVTVLGEIPDQASALREVERVLKPGGRLVVGESPLDPHYVPPRALRKRAAAVGLSFERQEGRAVLGYLARFQKAENRSAPKAGSQR